MAGLSSWRVSTRMQLLIGLTLAGLLVLCAIALLQLRGSMLEDRKEKTRNLVEVGLAVLDHHYQQVRTGAMTDAQARQAAKESLRGVRYAANDYYFIVDTDHVYLLQPANPALEGQNQKDVKDARGKPLIQEIVATANAGGGFVDYWFPRAGQRQAEPKLGYVQLFRPWGWVIGTGIYIDDVDTAFRGAALMLGGVSAVLIVLLILLGWRIAAGVLRQLGGEPAAAVAVMQRIADGDLSASVDAPPGSLLYSLGSMVASLRSLIQEINRSAALLVGNAEEISRASTEVSAAAGQQADATSAMAAAIEQLTVSSTHISDSARDTENDSREAMSLAGEGNARVRQASGAIQKIAATVTDASERIRALEGRALQISSIANVIKDIAGQTNLLALNAAIEAARAGEQGRGFAVVADEVRKLAERTSTATTEIEQMIAGIQGDTEGAVGAMNEALPEVEQGVQLAQSAAESLQAIENGAGRTLERVREVAAATQEQGSASTSIAQRVEQIAQMVEETTATVRSTADNAVQLERIAQGLQAQIARFRV
jgi:methyl-accepting chemotaxis protein